MGLPKGVVGLPATGLFKSIDKDCYRCYNKYRGKRTTSNKGVDMSLVALQEYFKDRLAVKQGEYAELLDEHGYETNRWQAKKILTEITRYKSCLESLC